MKFKRHMLKLDVFRWFTVKCNYSDEKRKDSLETRAVLIEISVLC